MKNMAVCVALIALCVLIVSSATATEQTPGQPELDWLYAVRIGVLKHDFGYLLSRHNKEPGVDVNAEIVFDRPSFSFLSGNIRPNLGASVNNEGYTSKLYAGLLWELEMKCGLFLNTGLGAAVHNGRLDTNNEHRIATGSRFLFRVPVEVGYSLSEHHQISIMADHVCNAFLAHPNQGFDDLGLRYTYRF